MSKVESVMLKEKVPELHKQHLVSSSDELEMVYEAGFVTVVRKRFPDESAIAIPISNVIRLRFAPEDASADEPAKRRGRPPKDAG